MKDAATRKEELKKLIDIRCRKNSGRPGDQEL